MRLVLRNYERLSYRSKTNNNLMHGFHAEPSETPTKTHEYSNRLKQHSKSYSKPKNYKQEQEEDADYEWDPVQEKLEEHEDIQEEMEDYLDQDASFSLQTQWEYIPQNIVVKDYELLKPVNKHETPRQLIKRYEENIHLNLDDHLLPKLYQEDRYFKRMAKYHLSQMGPLADSFLRQGYNFLDKKLLLHLLQKQNTKMIKQLLLGGAFQRTNAVDHQVLTAVFARYIQHQRNHFLINIVPYHFQLVSGSVINDPIKNQDQLVIDHFDEQDYFSMMYLSNGSTTINKLRLLWSLQRKYLHQYNLMEFIVPELKKLTFVTTDPQKQILVNKEVNYTMTTVFQSQVFEDFFFRVLQTTKTYPYFLKAWSVIILFLSKLRSIPKILDENSLNQLHPIFQIVQLSLPKNITEVLLKQDLFQFLLYEEHSQIQMQNFLSCMKHWEDKYLQPQTTLYNSALTQLTNQSTSNITVIYRQNEKAQAFATTSIVLQRKKIEEKPAITTQSQVIHNLLKGNYQSVFDDFLVRYSLPSNFDTAVKFQKKLKETDNGLSFRSKDEQALFKLKQAYNFFFMQSFSNPLKSDDFQTYKINLGVVSNLDHEVLQGEQIVDQDDMQQLEQYQQKIQKEIEQLANESVSRYLQDGQQQKQQDYNTVIFVEENQDIQDQLSEVIGEEQFDLSQQNTQKQKEILKMIKGNDEQFKKDEEPLEELVQMIQELLDNKLITKTFFQQLDQMPPHQAQAAIQSLLLKYDEYYNAKLQETSRLIEVQQEKESKQGVEDDLQAKQQSGKAKVLQKQRKQVEEKREKLRAKLNQRLSEEQNQFQKKLSGQREQIEDSQGDQGLVQSENESMDDQYISEAAQLFEAQVNEDEHSTQIDGAREDRALYFAEQFYQFHEVLNFDKNENESEDKIEPIQLEALKNFQGGEATYAAENQAEKQNVGQKSPEDKALSLEEKQQDHFRQQILKFLRPIQYFQQGVDVQEILQMTAAVRHIKPKHTVKKEKESQSQEFDSSEDKVEKKKVQSRDWKRSNNQLFTHKNKQPQEGSKKREIGFFKKIKSSFCTATTEKQQHNNSKVTIANLFDLQKIQTYRKQEVSRDFYNLMQLESHIPRVGDGNLIAKYLFLQGQRQDGKGRLDSRKVMTIQFSTVVGTRTKSYEKYIRNTVYNFQLQDSFYKSLLEDQLKSYNRNQFKLIVAHLIHYKSAISDDVVSLICQIAQNHLIGYSLVQIAQFIKANSIVLSPIALQNIAKVWQRFDLINEDLLPFLRQYCTKMGIPFKTQYYSHFCRSLIVTKKFQKLQALCELVFAEIKPKPFKTASGTAANEVQGLEKAWKLKQNEQYIKLYLQLLQVIVINLDTNKVPEYILQYYDDYIKLRPLLDEKEVGYGMVCYCLKKQKFYQLLVYLEKNPNLGTSFMYDCTLQALLSNFQDLQEYAERILDASLIINRIVLSKEQILKSMTIFKKAATSNAFSKFLEHCLRFQEDINKHPEIKRQMFYVLNHNVEQVSVAGIFNLLDFIFSDKRQKERIEYRALRLSEEEKERRLRQIQKQALINKEVKTPKGKQEEDSSAKEKKKATEKSQNAQTNQSQAQGKLTGKKKGQKVDKKVKKQKSQKKESQNRMADQILSDQQTLSVQAARQQMATSLKDDDIVETIRSQSKKHQSYKRKGVKAFGFIYQSVIEGLQTEELAAKQKQEKAKLSAKEQKSSKKGGKKR